MVFVICLIVHAIITERDVADGKVESVVRKCGIFKTGYSDIRTGIELLGNAARDAVQLHAVQTAVSHSLRQHTEEVTSTAGRLQNAFRCKPHVLYGVIDSTDHRGAGVMRV